MEFDKLLQTINSFVRSSQIAYNGGDTDIAVGHLIAVQDLIRRELIKIESDKCESAESSNGS